jgi:hypothetical protein
MNNEHKYEGKYVNSKIGIQKGGGFPFPQANGGIFSLMLIITGDTLRRINQRRTSLGLQANLTPLHFTLLQLHVNFSHPLSNIFSDAAFHQCVLQAVRNTLDFHQNPLILTSPHGSYQFLGTNARQFWARVYNFDVNIIRNFRMQFYNCINQRVPPTLSRKNENRGAPGDLTNYDIYEDTSGELYAINHDYYFEARRWRPHISIFELDELNTQANRDLLRIIRDQRRQLQDKNDRIMNRIQTNRSARGARKMDPISTIDIRRDMRQILMSVKLPGQPLRNFNPLNL